MLSEEVCTITTMVLLPTSCGDLACFSVSREMLSLPLPLPHVADFVNLLLLSGNAMTNSTKIAEWTDLTGTPWTAPTCAHARTEEESQQTTVASTAAPTAAPATPIPPSPPPPPPTPTAALAALAATPHPSTPLRSGGHTQRSLTIATNLGRADRVSVDGKCPLNGRRIKRRWPTMLQFIQRCFVGIPSHLSFNETSKSLRYNPHRLYLQSRTASGVSAAEESAFMGNCQATRRWEHFTSQAMNSC